MSNSVQQGRQLNRFLNVIKLVVTEIQFRLLPSPEDNKQPQSRFFCLYFSFFVVI